MVEELRLTLDQNFSDRFQQGFTQPTTSFQKKDLNCLLGCLLYYYNIHNSRNELEQFRTGEILVW